MQMIVVWKHRMGRRAEEIAVPDSDQCKQHREIIRQVSGREVLVDLTATVQELLEAYASERQRKTQAHG